MYLRLQKIIYNQKRYIIKIIHISIFNKFYKINYNYLLLTFAQTNK